MRGGLGVFERRKRRNAARKKILFCLLVSKHFYSSSRLASNFRHVPAAAVAAVGRRFASRNQRFELDDPRRGRLASTRPPAHRRRRGRSLVEARRGYAAAARRTSDAAAAPREAIAAATGRRRDGGDVAGGGGRAPRRRFRAADAIVALVARHLAAARRAGHPNADPRLVAVDRRLSLAFARRVRRRAQLSAGALVSRRTSIPLALRLELAVAGGSKANARWR